MSEYVPTIGLEIHAELRTRTKMFCNSKNDPNEVRPNWNVCPVCLAHPGTLPVINREAVKKVLQVGLALKGKCADYTEFDRKNYFYPDLPKGYQISQYEHPLVSGGSLNGVQITRVHLEEDTASSMHSDAGVGTGDEASGATTIDFNRTGIPLMELVTEPVIHSAEEAGAFARELQLLLRYLGASEANMEKGEMRVEANISVNKKSEIKNQKLGTKVEIKNLNSFRIMEKAVTYEIKRQQELLERGEKVVQETRGWDEKKGATFPQRIKEGSADYRYFPDPDLPSLRLSEIKEFEKGMLARDLPELPSARRKRYIGLGLKREDADLFVKEKALGDFFESVISPFTNDRKRIILSSNYAANDLVNIIRQRPSSAEGSGREQQIPGKQVRDTEKRDSDLHPEIHISPSYFREIIELLSANAISSRTAKDILELSIAEKRSPRALVEEKELFQAGSETDLRDIARKIINENPKVAGDFKSGKEAALGFLVGAGMKACRGVDPQMLKQAIRDEIAQ